MTSLSDVELGWNRAVDQFEEANLDGGVQRSGECDWPMTYPMKTMNEWTLRLLALVYVLCFAFHEARPTYFCTSLSAEMYCSVVASVNNST